MKEFSLKGKAHSQSVSDNIDFCYIHEYFVFCVKWTIFHIHLKDKIFQLFTFLPLLFQKDIDSCKQSYKDTNSTNQESEISKILRLARFVMKREE